MQSVRLESQAPEICLCRRITLGNVSRRSLNLFCYDAGEMRILLCHVVGVTERVHDFVGQIRYRSEADESREDEQKDKHSESNAENAANAVVPDRCLDPHGCPTP